MNLALEGLEGYLYFEREKEKKGEVLSLTF